MEKKYTEKKATPAQVAAIKEFAHDIKIGGELVLSGIADRALAREFRVKHARAGKLSEQWCEDRSFFGKDFLAIATECTGVRTSFVLLADGRRLCI